MGWSSAGHIFDPVARALIDAGVDGPTKRKVLGVVIKELQQGDWDTEDESLEQFTDDPDIVAAFADNGVKLHVDPAVEIERLRAQVATLEEKYTQRTADAIAEKIAKERAERELLVGYGAWHTVWSDGTWRLVTEPMTDEQREHVANAVVIYNAAVDPNAVLVDPRWWNA
jgi:hypothetical protein